MKAALMLAAALAPAAPAPKPDPDAWVLTVKAPTPKDRAEHTRIAADVCASRHLADHANRFTRGKVPSLDRLSAAGRKVALHRGLKVHADAEAGVVRVDLRGWPAAERPALKEALRKGWDSLLEERREILAVRTKRRAVDPCFGPPRDWEPEMAAQIKVMSAASR